nr:MAG TPA: hypothetical protein [Caudoviricetes sp.]
MLLYLQCQNIHRGGKLLWLQSLELFFLPIHTKQYHKFKILHLPSGVTETSPK